MWVCRLCKREKNAKGQDPCIADLPETIFACCGHGIRKAYASLRDGRTLRSKNIMDGTTLQRLVDLAVNNQTLPDYIDIEVNEWWINATTAQIDQFLRDHDYGNLPPTRPCWIEVPD